MKLTKPTESILNVKTLTRYEFGPHAAIIIDPTAGTVTFGWHSPAGYDSDSLSFTGGILRPSEDHKYNETVIAMSDAAALATQARRLNISLTREIETPEYLAALELRSQVAAQRRALLDGKKAIVVDWEPESEAVKTALAATITAWDITEETDKDISRYAVLGDLIVEQVEEEGEEPKIERVWIAK